MGSVDTGEWWVWRSDQGRLWATRTTRFSTEAENANAHRTVDADDLIGLFREIADQESTAALAGAS